MHEQETTPTAAVELDTEAEEIEDEALLPDGWSDQNNIFAGESDAASLREDMDTSSTNTQTEDNEEQRAELQRKAQAYDELQEQRLQEKFRRVYEEQITFGMSPAVARMIAANECKGKIYSLESASENAENTTNVNAIPDFQTELQQLQALYSDLREMPQEVIATYRKGNSLKDAYTAYRMQQSEQTIAALRRENAQLKQKAAAPVTGTTGGGSAWQKPDLFLEGFDSEDNF